MSEDAVLAAESLTVARHRSLVVDVSVLGSRPFQIVDLGDAFLPCETFAQALGVAHGRGACIGLVADQVVAHTVQIVSC